MGKTVPIFSSGRRSHPVDLNPFDAKDFQTTTIELGRERNPAIEYRQPPSAKPNPRKKTKNKGQRRKIRNPACAYSTIEGAYLAPPLSLPPRHRTPLGDGNPDTLNERMREAANRLGREKKKSAVEFF